MDEDKRDEWILNHETDLLFDYMEELGETFKEEFHEYCEQRYIDDNVEED